MKLLNKKKFNINFRQPKYIFPAFLFLPLLLVGYAITSIFSGGEDEQQPQQRNDFIQSDLPEANLSSDLGDKQSAIEDQYGQFSDSTAMNSVENDNDSVNKKRDYESRYSDNDLQMLKQQANEQRELQSLRSMQDRVQRNSDGNNNSGFSSPISDYDISRIDRARRDKAYRDFNQQLQEDEENSPFKDFYKSYGLDGNGNPLNPNTQANGTPGNGTGNGNYNAQPEEKPAIVTKVKNSSDYFHTIRSSSSQSNLITAIIDENIKVVEGSRVRLRLLDEIEIEGLRIKKGTYIYAIMSNFASQRVKGSIQSLLVGDELIRISLSMYDTDGLEGLYVPESSFRQTGKELMSSATENTSELTNNSNYGDRNNLKNWSNQLLQNTSQRLMNALQRRIQKNKVTLKYGTRVYLINSAPTTTARYRTRESSSEE